jgi:hypothetical protein
MKFNSFLSLVLSFMRTPRECSCPVVLLLLLVHACVPRPFVFFVRFPLLHSYLKSRLMLGVYAQFNR